MTVVVTVCLVLLVLLETSWFLVYVTGPWRSTRLGWVWLLKGGLLAAMWLLLLVDASHNVPEPAWAALGIGMVVAHVAWLWATIRARFGTFS
jgi:hypothetical protein